MALLDDAPAVWIELFARGKLPQALAPLTAMHLKKRTEFETLVKKPALSKRQRGELLYAQAQVNALAEAVRLLNDLATKPIEKRPAGPARRPDSELLS